MDEEEASLREALITVKITKREFNISSGSSRWASFVESWLKIFPPR
jgi:hypothetical protein